MTWKKLLIQERFFLDQDSQNESFRSQFHKDQDRVVFSTAFRKLAGKTQVHPLSTSDRIHNRLLHSLEVGSVGRSLGVQVGFHIKDDLPENISPDDIGVIVQNACYVHDIGNPPFGHAGEYAIQDWTRQHPEFFDMLSANEMDDLKNFEGNAQGFRLLIQTENHFNEGGLRLTYPTLACSLKYPWTYNKKPKNKKFAVYHSEQRQLDTLMFRLGIYKKTNGQYSRYPLSYLMEAADDICYALMDLEDAVTLNILTFKEVADIFQSIHGQHFFDFESPSVGDGKQLSALRGKVIDVLIDQVAKTFAENLDEILTGELDGDIFGHCPEHIKQGMYKAKELARTKVFISSKKTQVEIAAYTVLSTLLSLFVSAGFELYEKQNVERLSYRAQRALQLMEDEAPQAGWSAYKIYLRMYDFIASMTDQHASTLAKQISDPIAFY
ncbi:deoxyguanosinetriphosphate triphosphohydrolase [Marinicellulosiphila megalodicopiae]|uniref:deoxyguanosinetriphosphate triphosphohydrolase n=1 Tax=Marinicellulosiphila megalodicopiae TaxID=2724896 RepID=UPI003BAF0708